MIRAVGSRWRHAERPEGKGVVYKVLERLDFNGALWFLIQVKRHVDAFRACVVRATNEGVQAMKKFVKATIKASECGKYCGTRGRGCSGLNTDNNMCWTFLVPLRLSCNQSGVWQWKRCKACVKNEIK